MKRLTDEEINKIRIIVARGDNAEGLFNKSMKAACQAQLNADLKDLQAEREKIVIEMKNIENGSPIDVHGFRQILEVDWQGLKQKILKGEL
jgi:hypothetical protein